MARAPLVRLALALALAPLGLAAGSCTTIENHEVTELQAICVSSGNGTDGVTTEIALNVEFNTCLSSSCDTLVDSSCEASVEGDVIEVSGLASIDAQVNGACTLDCGLATASCQLEVANGTYTIRSGDVEFSYEIGTPAACSYD